MDLTPDQAASAVERHDCPNCDAPAGSACRTRGGKTTAKYHTARFGLVPALREELDVPVPADRGPGRAWKQGPALAVVPAPRTERAGPDRVRAYVDRPAGTGEPARSPPPGGVPQDFLRADQHPRQGPARAGEGARVGHQFKEAAPETPVIFTVHDSSASPATPPS